MPYRPAARHRAALPTDRHHGVSTLQQPPPFGTWPGGSEPVLHALGRFRELMASQGEGVHIARMCFDRLYAFERIAAAHATNHGPLRELALHLFQACHYGDPARHHD